MKQIAFCISLVFLISCTSQQNVVQVRSQVEEVPTEQPGLKRKVAIARFSNETQHAKGIFYEKANDPIANQAIDILSTKLASTNKFILLERIDNDKILEEMKLAGSELQKQVGADYLIIGSVTEFGRKTVGDVNAFSRSKTQTVYAGVSLRLVDVRTGQIIYSEEGKGEAESVAKTSMGLGERADYDATLNDKAISIAISKLVENITNKCMDMSWRANFISYDDNGCFIGAGASQGLKSGDVFAVMENGKKVKNPQTGMMIELPGKMIGKVSITTMGGDTPATEWAIVNFIEGQIDQTKLNNYFITEIK